MASLFLTGERDIPVWTLNQDLKMVQGTMSNVFSTGTKEVFRLTLRSGREIKASANHPFLTLEGWQRLDELSKGARIAIPRFIPEPQSQTEWPDSHVVLLAHLIGDGCFVERQPLHYTNMDEANLEAVTEAAKAFGVTGRLVKQKNWWHLYLPSPYRLTHGKRNPIVAWLDELRIYGRRSIEKFIPAEVFSLPNYQLALFLRHLWATDGHLSLLSIGSSKKPHIYYSTSSESLARDVEALLLRFGIVAKTRRARKLGYRDNFHVIVGADGGGAERFVESIGAFGPRLKDLDRLTAYLRSRVAKACYDTVPAAVWERVATLASASPGVIKQGRVKYLIERNSSPSRSHVDRLAIGFSDDHLQRLAESDVYWDEVKNIEFIGEEPVFDATVPGTHNFVAEGVVVENSLEQDSDVVVFIYRDEVYNSDSPQKGIAEIHIAKHRNGPIGKIELAFLEHYTKFANLARGV